MRKIHCVGRISVSTRTIFILYCCIAFLLPLPATAQSEGVGPSREAELILAGVNQARLDNGLPPLSLSPALNLAAQGHVDDVIANGNWGHYGSDGSNIQVRVARVGYPTSAVSENWVAVSDPDRALVWWMNDWIHRVNILSPRWDEIGIGARVADNGFWIFVTDFGDADGTSAPVDMRTSPATDLPATIGDYTPQSLPAEGLDYTIVAGDTLMGIAIRYGLDWQDIALANDMGEFDLLQIGQNLRLPGRSGSGGGGVVVDASVVAGKQTHFVRLGETLWTIAARHGVTWQEVAAVNGLGEFDLLQIDQELKLPASLDEEVPVDSSDLDEEPTPTPEAGANTFISGRADAAAPGETVLYSVRSGDTLLGIALAYDLTWETLAAANGIDEDAYLQLGQQLTIPAHTPEPSSATTVPGDLPADAQYTGGPTSIAGRMHTIETGDTIFGLAIQYDTDWQEILRLNGLSEDTLLQPGQEIKLP